MPLLMALMIGLSYAAAAKPSLWIIDVAPETSSSDYSIDEELQEIKGASMVAFADGRKLFKNCQADLHIKVARGKEDDLIDAIKAIPKSAEPSAMVGVARTNSARLAAFTLRGTPVLGVSVGAAAGNTGLINANFFSVATSWEAQWEKIQKELTKRKCKKVAGIFNPSSFLSKLYQERFREHHIGDVYRTDFFPDGKISNGTDCVVFGANYSDSIAALGSVIKAKNVGFLIATGDWHMARNEIRNLRLDADHPVELWSTTGWGDQRGRANRILAELKKVGINKTTPIAPYTYDATLLALDYLCNGKRPSKAASSALNALLLRSYSGTTETGNLISPTFLQKIELNFKQEKRHDP